MEQFFEKAGQLLQANSEKIAVNVSRTLNEDYKTALTDGGFTDRTIMERRAYLIALLGTVLSTQGKAGMPEELLEWTKQTAEVAVETGIDIDDFITTIRAYPQKAWAAIQEELDLSEVPATDVLRAYQLMESLLDCLLHTFNGAYSNHYKRNLSAAKKAFDDVSFPVVALTDHIAILPLIGELNEDRASRMLEMVLPACSSLKISELILDLSGVPRVDTFSTSQLFQLKDALNLVGISTTFTGIRPDLAVPMVNLGIPLHTLSIKGTLKNAISAYRIMDSEKSKPAFD